MCSLNSASDHSESLYLLVNYIYSLRFVSSKVRSICTYIKVHDTIDAVFEYVRARRLIVGYPAI